MPSQAELVNRVKQRVISSTALSDALGRPEGEVEYVSAEAAEVLALLVALIWLSAWTGFWLHSSPAGCHQPDQTDNLYRKLRGSSQYSSKVQQCPRCSALYSGVPPQSARLSDA